MEGSMSGTCLITGTPLLRLGGKLVKGFMRTPEQGAATPTYLALSPEVNGVSGKYFNAHQVIGTNTPKINRGGKAWSCSVSSRSI